MYQTKRGDIMIKPEQDRRDQLQHLVPYLAVTVTHGDSWMAIKRKTFWVEKSHHSV